MFCLDVTVVAEMEQSPVVAIATQNDVTSATSITSVGTSFRQILGTVHVGGTASSAP